jgi:hypothetical protein
MALNQHESAAACGLFVLGGVAAWVEYNTPAGMIAAVLLILLLGALERASDDR